MDKCREEFEKAFPIPAHWIEFDEKTNRYYCPYVADTTASTYQSKWVVWQHQQAKVEDLQKRVDTLELKLKEIANIAMRARRGEYYTESGRNAGLNIAAQLEQALKGEG
ncbi:hypothetical protein NRA17_02205 [Acinetobacter baumannii]|nr:hypothetical protein [Acinetobacter baumannii]